MEKVREPLYKIVWAGKDVSKDVSPYLLNLIYTDHLHGASDEIEMTFEDRDGRWKNKWYPTKGDKVEIKIGIKEDSDKWLKCGIFMIDEIELNGPPDIITVKGLSIYITESFRQKKTHSWENANLSTVISEIAKRNNLKSQIKIDPDIKFNRIDQRDESDLSFLKSICEKHGYNVKVDAERLICMKPEEIEKVSPVMKIRSGITNLISYRFSDRTHEIYKACEIRYWDPVTKKEISHTEKSEKVASGDTLKISERVENKQQAVERAKAELKNKNRWECELEFTYMGEPYLVAGATVNVDKFGTLDGLYLIEEAQHSFDRNRGYITTCKVRRI